MCGTRAFSCNITRRQSWLVFSDLLARLLPGGVACFQIPTYRDGYRFYTDEYLSIKNESDMEMRFFPQAELTKLMAAQNCRVLEIREDDSIGVSATVISNRLLVQTAT